MFVLKVANQTPIMAVLIARRRDRLVILTPAIFRTESTSNCSSGSIIKTRGRMNDEIRERVIVKRFVLRGSVVRQGQGLCVTADYLVF